MIKSLEKHWWDFEPVQPQKYREASKHITKANKVFNSMCTILKIRDSMRVGKKADKGISILKGAIK